MLLHHQEFDCNIFKMLILIRSVPSSKSLSSLSQRFASWICWFGCSLCQDNSCGCASRSRLGRYWPERKAVSCWSNQRRHGWSRWVWMRLKQQNLCRKTKKACSRSRKTFDCNRLRSIWFQNEFWKTGSGCLGAAREHNCSRLCSWFLHCDLRGTHPRSASLLYSM